MISLTLLYAPADRPELARKALAGDADVVILDLEDAVAPAAKDAARDGLPALLAEFPGRAVQVRINAVGTPWAADDIAMLASLDADVEVRVPKVESPEQVERLHAAGSFVIGTATTVAEAEAWERVGADAVCASGMEAGGHRGTFLGDVHASMIGTLPLVSECAQRLGVPVIAAGGIMNGRAIAAAPSGPLR